MNRQQRIADENVAAQIELWDHLLKARVASGISIDAVAETLEIDIDTVEAIEDGRSDVTMTELRLYSYSVGAVVTYNVTADSGFVNSVDEAYALPVRSVVLCEGCDGEAMAVTRIHDDEPAGLDWYTAGNPMGYAAGELPLPAKVLYKPVSGVTDEKQKGAKNENV